MPLQIVNIKDSKVKFLDENKDPVKPIESNVADLIFESMQKEMKISQLESDLGMALLEIMQIKMGVI